MSKNKKKNTNFANLIILILIFILLIVLLILCGKKIYNFVNEKRDDNKLVVEDPTIIDTNTGISLSLVNYCNYIDDTDKLGFNFIVASINFKGSEAISFDLSNLQTSQKIYLNKVADYLNKLNEQGYDINKLECVNNVSSSNNDYTCNIFIPYTTKDSSLRLLNQNDASMITFNLNENINYVTSLKFNEPESIVINNTSVNVSDSFISTSMLHNGEEYPVASTQRVYSFRINVNELKGNVMITDAYFLKDGAEEKIPVLTSDYKSEREENALGKKLVLGDNGCLFFLASMNDDNCDGTLMLMFSDKDEWVKVSTNLQ